LQDFQERYCYDRFWTAGGAAPHTRYLSAGHFAGGGGGCQQPVLLVPGPGCVSPVRHQHFLLFLIAHFQKAALLMFSDRLAETLRNLNISDPGSVRTFKRSIRSTFASFLRFTHRYWFHEISEQAQTRALFAKCAQAPRAGPAVCRSQRAHCRHEQLPGGRQPAPPGQHRGAPDGGHHPGFDWHHHHRLLGHEPVGGHSAPMSRKVLVFAVVFVVTIALTVYTMAKSKRLSDFLDVLSEERVSRGRS